MHFGAVREGFSKGPSLRICPDNSWKQPICVYPNVPGCTLISVSEGAGMVDVGIVSLFVLSMVGNATVDAFVKIPVVLLDMVVVCWLNCLVYSPNRPLAPQYSVLFFAQRMSHSASGRWVACGLIVVPHQHSRPYSKPTKIRPAHLSKQAFTVMLSDDHKVGRARPPLVGSAKQPA